MTRRAWSRKFCQRPLAHSEAQSWSSRLAFLQSAGANNQRLRMKTINFINRFLQISLFVGASLLAGAQTQASQAGGFPPRNSEDYWAMVDQFADSAVHLAFARKFVEGHQWQLTDGLCQQYSRISADYTDQLVALRRAGVSARSEFWNDVRAYSVRMIGGSGVKIPGRQISKYSMTTGSDAADRDLRRIVSLEIDESRSDLMQTGTYSVSASDLGCQAQQESLTAIATR